MCYIDSYEKEHQSSRCDDGSRFWFFPLPKNPTTESLELLGATIYFIGCWLKSL